MFRHVGVDEGEKNTSVKELGNKNTISNLCQTLTISIMLDWFNEFNDDILKNNVDCNNDEGNRSSKNFWI